MESAQKDIHLVDQTVLDFFLFALPIPNIFYLILSNSEFQSLIFSSNMYY